MPPDYSKADEKVMLYLYPSIAIFIFVACYFCMQYNDKQVGLKLAKDGITVYCRIDSVYSIRQGRSTEYRVVLDYRYEGKRRMLDISYDARLISNEDSIIIRKAADSDAPSYLEVIGVRHGGLDLIRTNKYGK